MRINNMRLSVIFKISLVMSATLGILIQRGTFRGELRWSVLNYYTLMANVLCAVYFFAAMIYEGHRGSEDRLAHRAQAIQGRTDKRLCLHDKNSRLS